MHLQLFKLTCKCVHLYLQRERGKEREREGKRERGGKRERVIEMGDLNR